MVNGSKMPLDAYQMDWVNNTARDGSGGGAAVIDPGMIVKVADKFFVAPAGGAIGETISLWSQGEIILPKVGGGGTALAVGQDVGFSFVGNAVTTDLSGDICGFVSKAAGDNDTSVYITLCSKPRRRFVKRDLVSAGEDSGNSKDIALPFPFAKAVIQVQIISTGNVHRTPQGAVTAPTASVVRVADTGLAAGEYVVVMAEQVIS